MKNKENINIKNYEIYIIDYLDGNLTNSEQNALFDFLQHHPDLQRDFELFIEMPCETLQASQVVFPHSELLKKNTIVPHAQINENNYQNYFIAFYENDLNDFEKQDIDEFLKKNIALASEFSDFDKCKLVPDFTVHYQQKQQLKHTFYKKHTFRFVVSAAAVFLLFFLLQPIIHYISLKNGNPVAINLLRKNTFDKKYDIPKDSCDNATDDIILQANLSVQTIQKNDLEEPLVQTQTVVREPLNPVPLIIRAIPIIITHETTDNSMFVQEKINTKSHIDEILAQTTSKDNVDEKSKSKNTLWNTLSWGVKQYNRIADNQIEIIEITNETTNESSYYICKE